MLDKFPKTRPPLTAAHQKVFESEYKLNRDGNAPVEGIAQKLEAWMHKQVAAHASDTVLEVGAGTLNHLPFEQKDTQYDVVEPFVSLMEGNPNNHRVNDYYRHLSDIPATKAYDRILSIAVLEHMTDLPKEIAQCGLLLKENGLFQAGIPSEGGFLWGMAWRCTTGLAYRLRNKLSYKTVMRHEHVNTSPEIISVLRYFFKDVTIKRFPTPWHHLSFYAYIEARNPDTTTCKDFLT